MSRPIVCSGFGVVGGSISIAARLNPQPQIARPDAPDHLTGLARSEWDRVVVDLVALGNLTDLDRGALATYCRLSGLSPKSPPALRGVLGLNSSVTRPYCPSPFSDKKSTGVINDCQNTEASAIHCPAVETLYR